MRKLYSRKKDLVLINLVDKSSIGCDYTYSISMPVGLFADADIHPTCGMCAKDRIIATTEDFPPGFYTPERASASLIWTGSGYLENIFPPCRRTILGRFRSV